MSSLANGQSVVISEFMAGNRNSIEDEDGSSSDWIELFNLSESPVDLSGWFLTDDSSLDNKWPIPSVVIEPNGYLLVFASGKDRRDPVGELHTNFKLSSGGEYLGLVRADGVTVEHDYAPMYPPQIDDASYGLGMIGSSGSDITLVDVGADVKFKVPTNGNDDVEFGDNPDSWIGLDFDDSGWFSAETGIGYAEQNPDHFDSEISDSGDVEAFMLDQYTSIYIRIPFTVSNPSGLGNVTLRMKYDDGFVAYLNGSADAFADSHAPGILNWESKAASFRNEPDALIFEDFPRSAASLPLQDGENVLCIHGLNVAKGSSDFLIVPVLEATRSGTGVLNGVKNYFLNATPGSINGDGSIYPGPIIRNVPKTVERPVLSGGVTDIVITAEVNPSVNPVGSVNLIYRVMFDAEVTVSMVDDGTGVDVEANDNIYTGLIASNQLNTGEMLRWRVEAEDSAGNISKNPSFGDPLDSPEYWGTVAANDAEDTSLLTIVHWFVENPTAATTATGTRGSAYYLGNFYDNIQTDLHGGSSRQFPKKSYDFDFNKGHRFVWKEGERKVKDVNFLTNWADKAKVRHSISYETIARTGGPAHFSFPVRIQQNGDFFSVAEMVEDGDDRFLERVGLDPDGALYKMYNAVDSATNNVEKKSRKYEGNSDLQGLVDGLLQGGDAKIRYGYDNVNIPGVINYLASVVMISNFDVGKKNFYLYRDSNGTKEWNVISWDVDLTWGRNWDRTLKYFDDTIRTNRNITPGGNTNHLYSLIFNTPELREMYERRIRTVLDTVLEPPGTSNGVIEQRLDEFEALIDPPGVESDADLDYAKWGTWGNGNQMSEAIARIKNEYLYQPGSAKDRRETIADTSSVPSSQVGSPPIQFGFVDVNPTTSGASADQSGEFITLENENNVAVDVSGWRIYGGVELVLPAGAVIPSGFVSNPGKLYVARDAVGFRGRNISPKANEKRLVVSGYDGQLSSRGETIFLEDNNGLLIDTYSYVGEGTVLQQSLRISEMQYHPSDPTSEELRQDPTLSASDFEFIELVNIGEETIDIGGARFSKGIDFEFPFGTTLEAGEHIVVVSKQSAFELRYGVELNVAGQYFGRLNNDGDTIQLLDAIGESVLSFSFNDIWYKPTDGIGYSLVVLDAKETLFNDWDEKAMWGISGSVGGSPAIDSTDYSVVVDVWKNKNFTIEEIEDPLISGAFVDLDGDMIPNLLEYGLGLDPKSPNVDAIPKIGVKDVEGSDFLSLTLRCQKNTLDLTYIVEVSNNFIHWIPATNRVGDPIDNGDGTETITFRSNNPVSSGSNEFIRVRFVLAP